MASAAGEPTPGAPTKRALDHKIDGNGHFAKRRFVPAISSYADALDVVGDDDSLRAVLLSNRSSCYYELGEYDKSAEDARACIAVIDASAEPSAALLCKNLWRLARALHYSDDGSDKDETHTVLKRLQGLKEESFSPKAEKMLENLAYYDEDRGNLTGFEPTLIRASFQDPYLEYYNFGHDEAQSLLRHESIESQSIHLKDLNEDELSSFAFLFGGVGDARHVMATLLDAHHQYLDLPPSKQDKFHLHCTLNDISVQTLAKDALVLAITSEIGRLAPDFKMLKSEREPFLLGVMIMYVTMGFAMPPYVHKTMVECIKRWFTESSREEFLKTFSWLHLSAQTWDSVVATMLAWIDADSSYRPKLPSVKKTLSNYSPSSSNNHDDVLDDTMSGLSMMGASSDLMSNMKSRAAQAKEAREQERREMAKMVRTMELTPNMIEMAKSGMGEDVTKEQIRDYISETMLNTPDHLLVNGGAEMLVSNFDKLFLETTHALNPSAGPVEELQEELAQIVLPEEGGNKDLAEAAIKAYRPIIHKTWVVNPVMTSPSYFSFLDGNTAPDHMNPVQEFPKDFLNDHVQSFMSHPPLNLKNTKDRDRIRESNTLCNNVIRYYWNVGNVLVALSGNISLDIDLGSIIALKSTAKVRESAGLPTKYHRCSLSNVPDYCGMLPIFCTIAPLLAPKSESLTPSLRSNCLLNTGIWKCYDDYVFSTTLLGYKDAEAIFRLKVTDDEPSTWGSFTTWEQASANSDCTAMPHGKLRTWIHRLYLATILPPDRDPTSMLREERPSTIDLFLTTLAVCIRECGIPAHTITSILDDLLATPTLVTNATLSNDSPASISTRNYSAKKKFNISAFHAELANRTAIFLQKNLLGAKALSTKALPVGIASLYELKLGSIASKFGQDWPSRYGGRSGSSSLGFMLQKQRGQSYGISSGASEANANPMLAMMAMMQGGGPSSKRKESKLRKALLDSGNKIGHVFSCMQWNLETQTASFWMCDDTFDTFKAYTFTLIRTDGWFTLPHDHAVLGDANKVIG